MSIATTEFLEPGSLKPVWAAPYRLGAMLIEIAIVPGHRWHSVRAALRAPCGGTHLAFFSTDDPFEPVRMGALLRIGASRAKTMTELCAAIGRPPTAFVSTCDAACCDRGRGEAPYAREGCQAPLLPPLLSVG